VHRVQPRFPFRLSAALESQGDKREILRRCEAAADIHTTQIRLCPKNALPGKWDDCTLKAGQTPVGLGITNG
jgi:hypothetical protein